MSQAFATPEIATEMRGFIRKAGGEGTGDRLAEYLGQQEHHHERFVITRSFDADFEHMYQMWTDPAHLTQSMPPTGATTQFLRAEPRVGGTSFYSMTTATGAVMHGRVTALALEPPGCIVYVNQFSDEAEHVIGPPFSANWLLAMHTLVTLVAESADCTRVTVCWQPQEANADDIPEFVKQRGGMTMGWTGSFDRQKACLEG